MRILVFLIDPDHDVKRAAIETGEAERKLEKLKDELRQGRVIDDG